MREKFDRNFVIYDRETVRTHRKSHPNQNVWKQEDLIITSLDFAKIWDLSKSPRRCSRLVEETYLEAGYADSVVRTGSNA